MCTVALTEDREGAQVSSGQGWTPIMVSTSLHAKQGSPLSSIFKLGKHGVSQSMGFSPC